jgi:hypothetical protein
MTQQIDVLENSVGVARYDLKPPVNLTESLTNLENRVLLALVGLFGRVYNINAKRINTVRGSAFNSNI